MSIYTKTGDKGETSIFGGKRLKKYDPQVEAYGNIDELSSFLGLLISKTNGKNDQAFLISIQEDLYKIMAFLSGANNPIDFITGRVTLFEQKIDSMQSHLPPLTHFILPVGTEQSSLAHIVRTIIRRAERSVIYLKDHSAIDSTSLFFTIQYLNRLSDFFFVLARWYNKEKELQISLLKKP